jgi:DNA-binding protein HU-beta
MATQLTKSQLIQKITDASKLSKKDVKGVVEALVTTGYKVAEPNRVRLDPFSDKAIESDRIFFRHCTSS